MLTQKLLTAFVLLIALTLTISSCDVDSDCPPVTTDQDANVDDFLGLWYEIASFPQLFQIGCSCTTAEYSLLPDGDGVRVLNTCNRFGNESVAEGRAIQSDPADFTRLTVSFGGFTPANSNYWILAFEEGSHMMVGDPNRSTLWILSRTPVLDGAIYNDLVAAAESMCFNTDNLDITDQSCNLD